MISCRKIYLSGCFIAITFAAHAGDDLAKVNDMMRAHTIGFTENKGQIIDQYGQEVKNVLYKVSSPGLDIYVTEKGLTYIFLEAEKEKFGKTETEEEQKVKWCRTDMIIKDANIKKENIEAEDPFTNYSNFYTPLHPQGILNVKTFSKVTVRAIYPGIDWVLYANGEGLKYDLVVHPGADPDQIKFLYEGAGKIKQDAPGSLCLKTSLGKINEGELKTYQKENTAFVTSAYILKKNEVRFSLGEYDRTNTLVIDPPLVWSTFCGGSMLDGPRGVDVDNLGNFIAAGYTASPTFFTVNPGGGAYYQGVSGGNTDVTILKFDNAGVLLWSTYYGGSSSEWAWDIDADNSGNILVTGRSHSPNFPTTNPGGGAFFQGTLAAGQDAFIIKFNAAGVCFWSTFYGGNSVDEAFGIASDANGNFALVGCTQSTDYLAANLILNPGGGAYYQPVKDAIYDLFLIKFDANCVMLWGTYYGGNSQDFFPVADGGTSQDLVFDAAGDLFVTGQTLSTNFPVLNPGGGAYFQGTLAGNFDAFIIKFTPTCVLQWGTYYGGASGDDVGFDTKVNSAGDLYVTGYTASTNFPTLNPGSGAYFQAALGGGFYDAFILRFDNAGVRKWSTYFGGSGRDIGFGSRLDQCDNYYVTGKTASANLFTVNPGGGSFFDASYNGSGGYAIGDMMILKFDPTNVCTWATYFGGNNDEWGEDIAIDAQANVFIGGEFVTGSSAPTLNPGGGAYYQASGNGNDDGAYLKFGSPTILNATTTQVDVLCNGGNTGSATATVTGGTSPYTYTWSPGGQTTQTATGLSAGTYTLIVSDANCNQLTSQITVTINEPTAITIVMSSTQPGCTTPTGTATATPSGGTPGYIYSWNNSQTTQTATGLNSGTYTVYVTDANGCTQTQTVTINSSGGPTATLTQTNILCNGQCTGTALANVTGGTSPYTYSWSNSQTTINASGLCVGNYTVFVTDANGCTTSQTDSITEPSAITATSSATTLNCSLSTATASVTPSGGTGPYTYSWTNPGGTTSSLTVNVSANYTCYISDANGCTFSVVVFVPAGSAPNVTLQSQTNILCNGAATGAATVTATGTSPFTYGWSPSGGTNATATGLGAGTYTITVTDAQGCPTTLVVTITQPTAITGSVTSTPSACSSSTGTASVNASGGTGVLTYVWTPSGGTNSTATGLAPGSYTVTITDANGCTLIQTVTITSSTSLVVNTTSTPAACGANDGTASATPSGGTAPYTYSWNNAQTTQTATGLAPGNYTVVISDANGCTQTTTVTVGSNGGPTANATASLTTISNGQSSQLAATGGGTYSWSPATGLSCTTCANPLATPTQTTTYCVQVTDVNGCTDNACVTIIVDVPCNAGSLTSLLPNAFSPDGNGMNDALCVPANACIKSFTLKVYDRWGEKVFETDSILNCWDGTYKGEALNTSVFVYYFEATLSNGDSFKQKGNISLIK